MAEKKKKKHAADFDIFIAFLDGAVLLFLVLAALLIYLFFQLVSCRGNKAFWCGAEWHCSTVCDPEYVKPPQDGQAKMYGFNPCYGNKDIAATFTGANGDYTDKPDKSLVTCLWHSMVQSMNNYSTTSNVPCPPGQSYANNKTCSYNCPQGGLANVDSASCPHK